MIGSFNLSFIKKEQIAENTFSFYFERKGINFDFIAGQYIRMILPHKFPDDRGTSRYFTISSSPSEKEYIIITTKIIKSTFKKNLFNLTKGNSVLIYGPSGNYILDNNSKPHIFISSGMGITPFRSMIKYVYDLNLKIPILLLATFKSEKSFIFYDELTKISKSNDLIKIIYSYANLEKIPKELLRKYIPKKGNEVFYICGSTQMIDFTRDLLLDLNFDIESINLEYFSGY